MPNYACFWCPGPGGEDKTLEDLCPSCGRPYGHPLGHPPADFDRFRVLAPLDRGFYSAAYVAEYGALGHKVVLKVTPTAVYKNFTHKRSFEEECRFHEDVANGSEHIVGIEDMMLDVELEFGSDHLECHVAVLSFVEGPTLRSALEADPSPTAREVAQIVIDLFRILRHLEANQLHHNDLHSGNVIVQRLEGAARRPEGIHEGLRLVAIDLGSASTETLSSGIRKGDKHWVATHLVEIARRLMQRPGVPSDLDYRLAAKVDQVARYLFPDAAGVRQAPRDLEGQIYDTFHQVQSPWRNPLSLRTFNESYNAQTLLPWHVPHLLVDDDDTWVKEISSKGPCVVTGMRGCGKTLLMRAVEFHARATLRENESSTNARDRVAIDSFVGLYASATRLLDRTGSDGTDLKRPYERLYVAYALEAIRSLRHLADLGEGSDALVPQFHHTFARALANQLRGADALLECRSPEDLERELLGILVRIPEDDRVTLSTAHPAESFSVLAEAIRGCSASWKDSHVLFLLDDVSTRHLAEEPIQKLLSELLFSSPTCSFKISSEAQTLELVLRSPGLVEKARAGRDYEVFDLGAQVNERMRGSKRNRRRFIEEVLARRAKYFPEHPSGVLPSAVLGDQSLIEVARTIASSRDTARERKEVYHGISVLASVCVGDVGDVINLYDLMLSNAAGKALPIPRAIQSEAYQDFCTRRLYDLNRRPGHLKNFALGFAEASYRLLVDSYEKGQPPGTGRLRQYTKIYVRVTSGDAAWQFEQLRDLIDAGVFVLEGGADSPRQKTRDSDPMLQFILTYRKLFGLSNFIGLGHRDRFELSGDGLVEWLQNPARGKEILLRHLGQPDEETEPEDEPAQEVRRDAVDEPFQGDAELPLFQIGTSEAEVGGGESVVDWVRRFTPQVALVPTEVVAGIEFERIVLGLGFEERTAASAERIAELVPGQSVTAVRYAEVGRSEQILAALRVKDIEPTITDYSHMLRPSPGGPIAGGPVLVDVTGLAKPVLFQAIRAALSDVGEVYVAHTEAEQYYPLDSEIAQILDAQESHNHYELLEKLSKVLTGEGGPYALDVLLDNETDETRPRLLCAFASPKHERLLKLLDERGYDRIEIISPGVLTARNQLADLAGEVAVRKVQSGGLTRVPSNEVPGTIEALMGAFKRWYVDRGFNVELALTGSKLQAVAATAAASVLRASRVWYVSPESFDVKRFTQGVGPTTIYKLTLPSARSGPG